MTTPTTTPNVPTFHARLDGSLTKVRVTLRAVYKGFCADGMPYDAAVNGALEVRADGMPMPYDAAVNGARAELFKRGLTASDDGRDFVAGGAHALRFWREGMCLPEAWVLWVPDALVPPDSVPAAPVCRTAPDQERISAFAAAFFAEPHDERAVAMLATKEGRWFVATTWAYFEFKPAIQARYDTLLALSIDRRGAETMRKIEADLSGRLSGRRRRSPKPKASKKKPTQKASKPKA